MVTDTGTAIFSISTTLSSDMYIPLALYTKNGTGKGAGGSISFPALRKKQTTYA